MVVLPRMSSTTTSRAFLSAAAAAMMPARSVEVIRFALCIVSILLVHPFPCDEAGHDLRDQALDRLPSQAARTDLGRADIGRIDGEQGDAGGSVAEAFRFSGVQRLGTAPIDDHEVLGALQVGGSIPGVDGSSGVSAEQDREVGIGMLGPERIHDVSGIRDTA